MLKQPLREEQTALSGGGHMCLGDCTRTGNGQERPALFLQPGLPDIPLLKSDCCGCRFSHSTILLSRIKLRLSVFLPDAVPH